MCSRHAASFKLRAPQLFVLVVASCSAWVVGGWVAAHPLSPDCERSSLANKACHPKDTGIKFLVPTIRTSACCHHASGGADAADCGLARCAWTRAIREAF